jgi:rubrerythrin
MHTFTIGAFAPARRMDFVAGEVRKCRQCGTELARTVKRCPTCGQPLSARPR